MNSKSIIIAVGVVAIIASVAVYYFFFSETKEAKNAREAREAREALEFKEKEAKEFVQKVNKILIEKRPWSEYTEVTNAFYKKYPKFANKILSDQDFQIKFQNLIVRDKLEEPTGMVFSTII